MKLLKKFNVPGFEVAGIDCGIKNQGQKDLALIASIGPAVGAGVFTKNKVCSPTVTISRQTLKTSKSIRAIIVNSGNANACTGERGIQDCHSIVKAVSENFGVSANQVLIASTGVIGVPLPSQKIIEKMPVLVNKLSPKGWTQAAEAIMTTDLVSKSAGIQYDDVVIGGICKGSGMIQPNMATMLSFLVTNISMGKKDLQRALKIAVDTTFNRITVDGETSTNDMVLLLANGEKSNNPVKDGSKKFETFVSALTELCRELAFKVVKDGEGVTKFVTVKVSGAKNSQNAETVARTVANSKLVQTAIFGQDPNWGRIICAVGYAGVPIDTNKIDISLNEVPLVQNGLPVPNLSTSILQKRMKNKYISIQIGLNIGKGQAEVFGCDLSYDYVRINAEYTT